MGHRSTLLLGEVTTGGSGRNTSRYVIFLLTAWLAQGDPLPAPKVLTASFPETTHDFGRVFGGEVVRHTFAITNAGPDSIEITQVKASCGCVALGTWTPRIPPGELGSIPFEFHTENYSGPVTETITVTFATSTQPVTTLRIQADVWRPIEVRPASAVFEFFPDEPATAMGTVRILNRLQEPLELSSLESNHSGLTGELSVVVPGREFDLTVRLIPPLKLANLFGKMTLRTSAGSMPILEVPVRALAPAPVSITPRTLQLPSGGINTATTRSVVIRHYGAGTLKLEAPVLDWREATVTLKESDPGKRFILTLNVPAGSVLSDSPRMEVSLKSDHPGYPVLRIPVVNEERGK